MYMIEGWHQPNQKRIIYNLNLIMIWLHPGLEGRAEDLADFPEHSQFKKLIHQLDEYKSLSFVNPAA